MNSKIRPLIFGILVAISLFGSQSSLAGITGSTIGNILIYEGGSLVYVYPTNGVSNPPTCHGSNGNYYSFLLTTPYAKEYLAGLLAAQARGAYVTFYGYGDCRDQSVSETLAYFSIS